MHNETLSVVAVCVSNPDRFARWNPLLRRSPTPTGFGEIIGGDDFPFTRTARGKQLLFDLRQNAFHLFFAEGAHGLGLDVSQ
jgi:hypothetical protein